MEKWASLTWDDLEEWAGSRSVSRGRSYREEGRVQKLAISNKGRLLATVEGGDRYVVSVWLEFEEAEDTAIESECTCPVGESGCKHAVAVVAEYLELLGRNQKAPLANPEDPRWG